ncbi:phosphoribosylformylglycinamidine synthase subunit II [Rubellimicrobium thermophilum DSM 16684]|uniref:Phosphoribosylformylglycinamidine synthase subunit PurL n=1 Tax=Rubellimicrobium thermophilum DSM 16684 TaxID=1123069 RepID=S9QY46_9RHOB|nr:phosphoribosylformylglycinamidine synthase subunit PurL [Rubellimicrobium thermophilum]EPX86306.1 phosphoribosylformylglycinamidine synthase subunit II [Rubellimicrobium thermophilum DSM 16684]
MTPEPAITPDLVAAHGIKPDEWTRLLELLGREPTFTELGIVSAMWNEHCSYKSSKKWLRTLHTTGPQVVIGPGENAGVVDLGDGDVLVFKMESHNHPSYIEPYQGAATGVGGILRDVFTMGARPIAAMNALSFGEPSHPKTRRLLSGVVEGIGGYGNAFGVPTVGGEVRFHPAYNGNCLVNAFAAGIAKREGIFTSAASGVGRPVVYLGARTGRDGVGGATMASAEFDDSIEEKRPTVQVGDPFTEKRLMEACLELMASGAVVSIQDMGAAGLTCSAVEMGDKGGLGIRLDLDRVPVRETGMTAYEMMLSESQERMLMVLHPEKEAEARAIFEKWDLDFAIIGETIPEDRFLILQGNTVKADLPLSKLASSAPEYDRPWVDPPAPPPLPEELPRIGAIEGLRTLLLDPNHAWKGWIWEQYDSQVGADTIRPPGSGAGIVRVHGTAKAVAFTSDVTPRYVKANPREGGRQAVAEAWRNLVAVGARPLAATDNLNFGNPEKPEIMGQFVGAILGIGEACRALDFPIVSGNVSLYNETDGRAILPTPTIGGVGLLASLEDIIAGPAQEGDALVLIGREGSHLGQSALLAALGIEAGEAPPVDLETERRHGEFVLANRALIRACTDLSDGGLALAAFEMAAAAGCGAEIGTAGTAPLFGEDQARYLCATARPDALIAAAEAAGVPAGVVGRIGGADLRLGGESAPMDDLVRLWRTTLARLFD